MSIKRMMTTFLNIACFSILLGCNIKPHSIYTQVDSEISSELQEVSRDLSEKIVTSIKLNNYDNFLNMTSDHLQQTSKGQLRGFFTQLTSVFSENEFEHFHTYFSTNSLAKSDVSSSNVGPIIPSLTDTSLFIINNFNFIGKKSLNIFLKSTNKGMQNLFLMSFSEYDGEWKLNAIAGGDWGVDGLDAQELIEKASEYSENSEYLSSVAYSLISQKVLRPSTALQYPNESDIVNKIKSIQNNATSSIAFPIVLSEDISIIGIDAVVTKEGINPVIVYTTKTVLQKEPLDEEAKSLLPKINKTFKDIINFDFILLKAFNEAPIDPHKQYQAYSTVINLSDIDLK